MAAARRWRLDLAYDGRGYRGFAAQPGRRTVAGALADSLCTVLRLEEPPAITCAGRTDAGVHALGQVVHCDLPDPLFGERRTDECERLAHSCNKLCAPSLVVTASTPVADSFDARRSAVWRRYRYLLHEAPRPSPLLEGLAWHVGGVLEDRAMAQAAYALLGEHDFRAFCRRPPGSDPDEPIVRRVLLADVVAVPDPASISGQGRLLRVDLAATSFCHQMVRSVVAVLVQVGSGARSAADLVAWLRAGSRSGLPAPAPAHGLCLVEVGYDPGRAPRS